MNSYIKASEYCLSVFDGTHDTPKPAEHGRPLLTSKNILGGRLNLESAYNISLSDYESIQKRSAVSQWDILFSMIGSVGEVYLETSERIDYAIKNVGVFSTLNEDKARWLYLYLTSPYAKKFIENYMTGAVQKFLGLGVLRDFPVIPYDESKKPIIKLISALDEKVELNRRINAELEQMARKLYDYWFVQFDFPGSDGKPYKSSGGQMIYSPELKREIPKNWQVRSMSEILPVVTGKRDANHATIDGEYNFFTCGEEILKSDTYKFEGKAILVAGNGNFGVKLYNGKFDAYQRTYVLIPKNESLYTIVYLATLDMVASLTKGSRGSIIKFITKGDLEDIQVPLPKDIECNINLLESLNKITEKIEANRQESQKLAHLRDWLLPMLMNGQVRVK